MSVIAVMDRVASYNVARKYEKRSLLIAINAVAGLSIFFFGYDQGVMGGVNGNRDYARTMGFGDWDGKNGLVNVTRPLLQGGIVRHSPTHENACGEGSSYAVRSPSIIFPVLSLVPSWAAGLEIDTDVLRPSL